MLSSFGKTDAPFINQAVCFHLRAALRVTEGMKKEQESLVKQLDMLR